MCERFEIDLALICRTSNKSIQKMLRGFFLDHRHLAKHFTWLTNTADLTVTVEENLHKQIGNCFVLLLN